MESKTQRVLEAALAHKPSRLSAFRTRISRSLSTLRAGDGDGGGDGGADGGGGCAGCSGGGSGCGGGVGGGPGDCPDSGISGVDGACDPGPGIASESVSCCSNCDCGGYNPVTETLS